MKFCLKFSCDTKGCFYSYFNPPDLTTGGDTCGRFETLAGLGAEVRGVVR